MKNILKFKILHFFKKERQKKLYYFFYKKIQVYLLNEIHFPNIMNCLGGKQSNWSNIGMSSNK